MESLGVLGSALFQILAQSAPYVVLGYLAAGIIREFISFRALMRNFGEKGIWPLARAVGVGALLPICSCGVVALGVGVYRGGAARGTTLSFMTSSPTISPVAVLLAVNLLGIRFALIYIGIMLAGSFLIGLVGNRLLGGEKEKAFRSATGALPSKEAERDHRRASFLGRVAGAVRWAFWDLGSEVSLDLVLGLSLATLIITYLPMGWVATWLGRQEIASLLYVVVVGLFIYTCSVPSLYVLRSLLLMGVTPGAAAAFMLSGPATNLGELFAIRRAMGRSTAVYYWTSLLVVALVSGIVVDHVFYPNYVYQAGQVDGQLVVTQCCVPLIFGSAPASRSLRGNLALVPTWHYPFAVLLAFIVGLGAFRHTYRVWVSPCRFCMFWQEELGSASCRGKCWTRSLHGHLRRALGRAASARGPSGGREDGRA